MNQQTVISSTYLNEFINGAAFASDTADNVPYLKALAGERIKRTSQIEIRTFVAADITTEIQFDTAAGIATWTHPYSNWAQEGFKAGDTINVVKGASTVGATISTLTGTVMKTNDPGFTAGLTIVTGTAYNDLIFRNTTVPTSVVMEFGIIPNILPPPAPPSFTLNPFGSWLDGQVQAYKGDGLSGAPTTLTRTFTNSAEISESITVDYIGVDALGYIFTFEIIHIFRPEFYIESFLTNFQDESLPSSFTNPNNYRYISRYKFGTSSTDPNEYRIFWDNLVNGNLGFVGNNFNAGAGDYELVSIAYEDPNAVVLDQLEATEVTTVTIQIEKTSGNFSGGQTAIVMISKLPDDVDYSNNASTWQLNHVFEQLTQSDGAAAVNGTYIKNLLVDVNASPQYIDITFDVDYDTTAQGKITDGDNYFIGVLIGDVTLPATTSDRKIVSCDVNTYTKSAEIQDLITNLNMNFYSSEKRPGFGVKTSNVDTWDNRLHICTATFDLLKLAGSGIKNTSLDISIISIDAQFVSRNSTTGESFVLDTFNMPFNPVEVIVDGGLYQAVNADGYRGFDIKEASYANAWSIDSAIPVAFDSTQQWSIVIPFVIPWRTVVPNPNVDTSFYNSLQPNNNLNNKTSNYSNVAPWVTYFRLLVKVYHELTDSITEYGLYSYNSIVRDFDEDPDTFNWTGSTKLYNPQGIEVNFLCMDQDTTVTTTFSMATAGALTAVFLVGEITIEEYNSAGKNNRLNSVVDWLYDQNILKPLTGQNYVKVTQDVVGNTITVECLVDYTKIDPTKSYTIMSHLQDTK